MQDNILDCPLTTWLDLSDVIAREPAGFAVKASLPPSTFLLACDMDKLALVERQLVLIVLLEIKACLDQQLPATSIFRHFLDTTATGEEPQQAVLLMILMVITTTLYYHFCMPNIYNKNGHLFTSRRKIITVMRKYQNPGQAPNNDKVYGKLVVTIITRSDFRYLQGKLMCKIKYLSALI